MDSTVDDLPQNGEVYILGVKDRRTGRKQTLLGEAAATNANAATDTSEQREL
ncbi:hypothetical protein [Azonexus hydrophilus]|uniref:hypothetical protein n=1 Tax=Azonexus hydrophilus TaxID=418702 RepID=UPI001962ED59|nr:hypothetical protein [Azonexus hydrophilus]